MSPVSTPFVVFLSNSFAVFVGLALFNPIKTLNFLPMHLSIVTVGRDPAGSLWHQSSPLITPNSPANISFPVFSFCLMHHVSRLLLFVVTGEADLI